MKLLCKSPFNRKLCDSKDWLPVDLKSTSFEMPCLCIYYIGGGSQNGGFEFKKIAAGSNWGISSHFPPFFSISNKSCGI